MGNSRSALQSELNVEGNSCFKLQQGFLEISLLVNILFLSLNRQWCKISKGWLRERKGWCPCNKRVSQTKSGVPGQNKLILFLFQLWSLCAMMSFSEGFVLIHVQQCWRWGKRVGRYQFPFLWGAQPGCDSQKSATGRLYSRKTMNLGNFTTGFLKCVCEGFFTPAALEVGDSFSTTLN